ncbi:MAG TPA: Xaa-Pro peptidase family protein [Actinomycetota bacterium]|nr:Xaa-Pro peptidase family protein [Actinomycetota bacterium]
MDGALRRERLAAELRARGLDALLVTRLPNVRYLSGFTGSNGQVVVAADARAVLLTDGRYEGQAAREAPDLERVVYRDRAPLPHALDAARSLGASRLGFEASLAYREARELEERADGLEVAPVDGLVERLRWVKDEEELRALARAQELTDLAFARLPDLLREGLTERDLALELEFEVRRAGAEALAFDPIVAFGEHAAEPHHRPCDRALRRGDVVKVDLGARASGYHADTTRTVAFGEPPAELRELHALVARAQAAGLAALRAGARTGEVDAAARGTIAEAGFGERFPHGLGHGVGLEIHEGPWLRAEGAEELPAGAVVTVEPGVYVPGLGGVRIEDVAVVGPEGARVLGRVPRELVVV